MAYASRTNCKVRVCFVSRILSHTQFHKAQISNEYSYSHGKVCVILTSTELMQTQTLMINRCQCAIIYCKSCGCFVK